MTQEKSVVIHEVEPPVVRMHGNVKELQELLSNLGYSSKENLINPGIAITYQDIVNIAGDTYIDFQPVSLFEFASGLADLVKNNKNCSVRSLFLPEIPDDKINKVIEILPTLFPKLQSLKLPQIGKNILTSQSKEIINTYNATKHKAASPDVKTTDAETKAEGKFVGAEKARRDSSQENCKQIL